MKFIDKAYCIKNRAISSVGSEHLVYTEGVGGSNPSLPTKEKPSIYGGLFFVSSIDGFQIVYSSF